MKRHNVIMSVYVCMTDVIIEEKFGSDLHNLLEVDTLLCVQS